jgi:hypothetical protein
MEELLKQLGDQSPMLAIMVAFGVWVMRAVVQPLTARHIQFMDAFENRDREKTEILGTLQNNLVEFRKTQDEHIEICRSGTYPRPIHKQA